MHAHRPAPGDPRAPDGLGAGAPAGDIGLSFVILVLLGFLINTEEVAWRGFGLPRLQVRYGALAAALLITIPEVLLE